MTIALAVAFVMTVVQFVKKVIPTIAGTAATIVVVLASVGVTFYKFFNEALPIGPATLLFFVQVVVGAIGAYSLIKVVKPQ